MKETQCGFGFPGPHAPLLLVCSSWKKVLGVTWIYSAYHSLKAAEIREVFQMLPLHEQEMTPISTERVSGCSGAY